MPNETYEQIIEEIKALDASTSQHIAQTYCIKHAINSCENNKGYMTDMALDVAARTREAVGGSPHEWWVEDADGNRVHIGDQVEELDDEGTISKVEGLSDGELNIRVDGYWLERGNYRKYIPDTREKIICDTLAKLDMTGMYLTSLVTESIGQAVDRAMKLGAVDA